MSPAYAVGVDVGGTKIAAGLVDRDGRAARHFERPTPTSSQRDLVAALESAIASLVGDDVSAIGVGIPSTIDQRSGRAVSSVNVPLTDFDLRAHLRDRFHLPVAIDNDANVAAIAEWRIGAGRGSDHMLMLTLGTGIGGGLILGGRPYRGAIGSGAELGHVVIEHDGPPCQGTCTGRGHLETLASGRAADAAARSLLGADADARDLLRQASDGDGAAREAIAELGRRLGSGIGSLVNIFNPELVVVGGGFSAAGDLLLEPAREILRREALQPARDLVRVVPAELGPAAGVVGAGLVGFEALDAA